jgi:hypothetical protein
MKTDVGISAATRRFGTGGVPQVQAKHRGTGRMIGSPAERFDRGSLWVVLAITLFTFVLSMAINGFFAILWLIALGPLCLAMFAMLASMGGVECQRAVATVYVIVVGILLVWAAGA